MEKSIITTAKERNPYFDNAKAILIILVVLGHTIQPFKNQNYTLKIIFTFIYLFHIPAFVLLSGYFSKHIKNLSKVELKYIGLYLISTLLYYPLAQTNLLNMLITPYLVLWYLISLVSWYVLIHFFSKIKNPITSILLSFTIAIIVGYIPKINETISLSRILVLFPFFLIGYNLKSEYFIRLKQFNKIIPIIMLIFIFICLYFININYIWLFFNSPYIFLNHYEWYAGIYRICLLIMSLITTICFFIIVPDTKNNFTWIGKHTLIIFILHGLILLMILDFL